LRRVDYIQQKTQCDRCGTCCRKGGPALHEEDKELVRAGHISYENLFTVRKGELAVSPVTNRLEPALHELVKVSGKGPSWTCLFFASAESACGIYENRPLECRVLQCWNPEKILEVVTRGDAICRADILNADDPVMQLILMHDEQCPPGLVEEILTTAAARTSADRDDMLEKATVQVRKDLDVRRLAAEKFGLSASAELFLLGRPLFTQVAVLGISTMEKNGEIFLKWD